MENKITRKPIVQTGKEMENGTFVWTHCVTCLPDNPDGWDNAFQLAETVKETRYDLCIRVIERTEKVVKEY